MGFSTNTAERSGGGKPDWCQKKITACGADNYPSEGNEDQLLRASVKRTQDGKKVG